MSRTVWLGLLDLLYPPLCLTCRAPLVASTDRDGSPLSSFCPACADTLRPSPAPTCPRCAADIGPHALVKGGCAHCREERFAFDAVCRLGPYDGLLREAILLLKHGRNEGLAEILGEVQAAERREQLLAFGADVVVPVPLHWWRRLRRGYNQSDSIARGLAKGLGLPLLSHSLRRRRRTKSQPTVAPSLRRDNVRGAFRAFGNGVQGRIILLVDDIFTTGSTAHESARALREAGAARVVVAVLARAGID